MADSEVIKLLLELCVAFLFLILLWLAAIFGKISGWAEKDIRRSGRNE